MRSRLNHNFVEYTLPSDQNQIKCFSRFRVGTSHLREHEFRNIFKIFWTHFATTVITHFFLQCVAYLKKTLSHKIDTISSNITRIGLYRMLPLNVLVENLLLLLLQWCYISVLDIILLYSQQKRFQKSPSRALLSFSYYPTSIDKRNLSLR